MSLILPLLAGAPPVAAQTTIAINPSYTYLMTSGETVPGTVPIQLSTLGLRPGEMIRMERLGDFRPGPIYTDVTRSMIAVFSASATLLSSSNLHRVQDAIDAGPDVVTAKTYNGSLATDVPEDFAVLDATVVVIPPGATHLFVAASDSLYHDNDDPDKDFAVRISSLPLGTALSIWGGLLAALPTDITALDVETQGAPPPVIDIRDAVRIARRAAGLDSP